MTLPVPAIRQAPWDLEFERLKFVDAAAGVRRRRCGRRRRRTPDTAGRSPRSIRGRSPRSVSTPRELAWGDRQFGEVRATLAKLEDGVSLKELTATSASYGANATGEWRIGGSRIKGTHHELRRRRDHEAARLRRGYRGEKRGSGVRSLLARRPDGRCTVAGRGPRAGVARQGSNRRFETRRGPRARARELLGAAAAAGARFQRRDRQRVRFRHRSREFRPARRQRLHR